MAKPALNKSGAMEINMANEWDEFQDWWSKQMHRPINTAPTATPEDVYRQCAWTAWNARAKHAVPEEGTWDAAIEAAARLVDREEGSPSLTEKVRALKRSSPQEER